MAPANDRLEMQISARLGREATTAPMFRIVRNRTPTGSCGLPRRLTRLISWFALIFSMAGTALAEVPAPGDQRDELTAETLFDSDSDRFEGIHNGWFMPVGDTDPALHEFSGRLIISETEMAGFDGRHAFDGWFPEIEIGFVSYKDHLIPVDAGILDGTGVISPWNVIVSPGRVWSESVDGGLSRASFPFVLAGGRWWNEAHNGLATFVFDDQKVSDVRFQVVQETAPYNNFVAFGRLEARYDPGVIETRDDIIETFERDQTTRLPVRSFDDLETVLSLDAHRAFAGTLADGPFSASGVILDDTIYLRPCKTQYGDFPYCDEMRHGVFSVTKSLGGLVGMLHLAQEYGDHIFDLKIKDYLDVTAEHSGWDDVTFADALNMATGIGEASLDPGSRNYWAEIYPGWKTTMFLEAATASEKLRAAFYGRDFPWGPGEVFRYRNMDTFVLAAAMDSLVKREEGPDASLWDTVVSGVYRPIGVMALPMEHTTGTNGKPGIPLLAAGAYPNVHDIAKITRLLQNSGRHGDQQLLSKAKLDEALYRTDVRGLEIAGHSGESYHSSFWYFRLKQLGCDVQVPRMDGWGGNLIELFPNGATAFILSDDFWYEYKGLAEAAHEIRSLCAQ